eukprot:scaffold662_cov364-Pavlova_lutheri.AAC.16
MASPIPEGNGWGSEHLNRLRCSDPRSSSKRGLSCTTPAWRELCRMLGQKLIPKCARIAWKALTR